MMIKKCINNLKVEVLWFSEPRTMSSSQRSTDDPHTPLKQESAQSDYRNDDTKDTEQQHNAETQHNEVNHEHNNSQLITISPSLSIELQTVSNHDNIATPNTTQINDNSPKATSPMLHTPTANSLSSPSSPLAPVPTNTNPNSLNEHIGSYLTVNSPKSLNNHSHHNNLHEHDVDTPTFLVSQRNSTSYTKPLTQQMDTIRVNDFDHMNTIRSNATDNMMYMAQPTFRHALTQRDELLFPSRDQEPDDINFEIAIIYLRDALKIRPPQRRVQDLLGAKFKPLLAYKIMKSWVWSHFIYTLIWFNMLLAVWEPPQDINPNEKEGYWNQNRVTIVVVYQLIFIFFYSLDICLKFYSHDKREIGQWTYVISIILFYDFVISIITFFWWDLPECEKVYRSSRIIRPFFLFYKSRDLKKLARSILRGIPSLFEVAALIILFLLLFSFAAYYLFHESGQLLGLGYNENFKTFQESVYSLMVLQTTANVKCILFCLCGYIRDNEKDWYF